jgi:uracil-DNA glycosylase family 4
MMKSRLQQHGINWREMFIVTASRCVMDKRTLSGKEVTATLSSCRHYIESVIYQVKPKVILCAGDFAFRQIMRKSGIKKNRGQWFWNEEFACWVIATLHPNFIMRNMAMEAQLIEDIRMLSELIENDFQPPVIETNSSYREITSLAEMHRPKKKPKPGVRMVRTDSERPMGEDWADFLEGKLIGLDTEGQGLDWANPEYVMISYSLTYETGTGYSITFYEECDPNSDECVIQWQQDRWAINEKGKRKKEEVTIGARQTPDFAQKVRELAQLLLNEDIKKSFLNGAFDYHVFRTLFRRISKVSIPIRGWEAELQVLAHLIEENIYKMASLEQVQKSFTTMKGNYNSEFGAKYEKGDMIAVPLDERTQYACADTDVTFQAYHNMMRFLKERNETEALHYFKTFAMPTLHTLFEMEEIGAYVDKDQLPIATKEVALLMEDAAVQCSGCIPREVLEKEVHQAKGIKFTRDTLVRDILFSDEGYGLKVIKRTKAKEPSVDKNVRKLLLDMRLPPKARTFLENLELFKMYHTLWSRYLRGFKKAIKADGRIHTRYGMCMAVTGRINSSDPNLMNIPKRGPSARIVRSLIAAKPGYVLLAADESQSELRWLAHQSRDPAMIKVFRSGEDIHVATGKVLSGAKWNNMNDKEKKKARQNAKPVNFGLVFGMSAKGFVQYAKQEYGLALTIDQAESWIAKFFGNYKRIKTFHRDTIDFCRRHGYVISPLGRKRRLPEINSNDPYIRGEAERQAINHPIQAPSSDVVLMAANEIRKQGHDPEIFRPILFIHDELVYEVKADADLPYYARIIKTALENPPIERDFGIKLSVPLLSDVSIGPNLADMKDFDL